MSHDVGTDPSPQDPFQRIAHRAGRAARASTEELVVTTAELHQHRQRTTRLGVAAGAAALTGAAVLALVLVDRPTDAMKTGPAGPSPTAAMASPTIGPETRTRALSSLGLAVATPPYWSLTDDGATVATFDLITADGHQGTARAFIVGSVASSDGTLHPVPEDLRDWAASREDISVLDTGGMTAELGTVRYVVYDAPAGAPSLACPEAPTGTTCSVPPVGTATSAGLDVTRDAAGRTWAVSFYPDPGSDVTPNDTGALTAAFHRP